MICALPENTIIIRPMPPAWRDDILQRPPLQADPYWERETVRSRQRNWTPLQRTSHARLLRELRRERLAAALAS